MRNVGEEEEGAEEARAGPKADDADALFTVARAAWPGVNLTLEQFASRLRELKAAAGRPVEHPTDLYLAVACAHGDEAAMTSLVRHFARDFRGAVTRVDSSSAFGDDAVQAVHEKLFVSRGESPSAISEYRGTVPLRNWLRVVAKRCAVDLARSGNRHAVAATDAFPEAVASGIGADVRYMKELYTKEFEEALGGAFRELSPRDRTLLRLNLLEGMTLVQLGTAYAVSHTTVARWLAATREQLGTRVKQSLILRLRLSPTEFESVAGIVRSQLDVRMAELLRSTSGLRGDA